MPPRSGRPMAVRAQAIGRTGPAPMPLPAVGAHAGLEPGLGQALGSLMPRSKGTAAIVRRRRSASGRLTICSTVWRRAKSRPAPSSSASIFPSACRGPMPSEPGIAGFRGFFDELGAGAWPDFFTVAERAEEIGSTRPFYPLRPGRKGSRSRRDLLDGLGLEDPADLLRRCDRGHGRRRAAGALFWTLGAQQVGKAAIVGWRDLFLPALAAGRDLALWPFDGSLPDLLSRHEIVAAETYPGGGRRQSGACPGARRQARPGGAGRLGPKIGGKRRRPRRQARPRAGRPGGRRLRPRRRRRRIPSMPCSASSASSTCCAAGARRARQRIRPVGISKAGSSAPLGLRAGAPGRRGGRRGRVRSGLAGFRRRSAGASSGCRRWAAAARRCRHRP